jgi:hypothetical protein
MQRKSKTQRRNIAADRHAYQLAKTEFFRGLPRHVLRGYSVLFLLSGEIGVKLKEQGLTLADGTWNPGIDILRRVKDSERQYLQLMLEMGRDRTSEEEPSLAAEFARADEAPDKALPVGDEEEDGREE